MPGGAVEPHQKHRCRRRKGQGRRKHRVGVPQQHCHCKEGPYPAEPAQALGLPHRRKGKIAGVGQQHRVDCRREVAELVRPCRQEEAAPPRSGPQEWCGGGGCPQSRRPDQSRGQARPAPAAWVPRRSWQQKSPQRHSKSSDHLARRRVCKNNMRPPPLSAISTAISRVSTSSGMPGRGCTAARTASSGSVVTTMQPTCSCGW